MNNGIIYCAHNIINNQKYIGQTINRLEYRISQHKRKSKDETTKFLKALFDGENYFIWGILEECDISFLDEREKYWIKYFNSLNSVYNSTIGGNIPFNPNKVKNFIIVSPNNEIIKSKNISKFCRINNLHQGHISSVLSGKIKSYKGWKLPNTKLIGHQSTAEHNKKEFIIKTPAGDIVSAKGISEFCDKNNLSISHISQVLSGKRKTHKGYKLP